MAIKAGSKKLDSYAEFKEITPSLRKKLERKKLIYQGRLSTINKVLKRPTSKEKQSGKRNSEVV